MRCVLVVLLATAAACGSGTGSDVTYEADNAGGVCLYPSDPGTTTGRMFEAGAPVFVGFSAHCFDGCDFDRSASCSVGPDQLIESTVMWTHHTPAQGEGCTLECGIISASCATDPLPAGNYTFSFAGASLLLTVPSTAFGDLCIMTPPVN